MQERARRRLIEQRRCTRTQTPTRQHSKKLAKSRRVSLSLSLPLSLSLFLVYRRTTKMVLHASANVLSLKQPTSASRPALQKSVKPFGTALPRAVPAASAVKVAANPPDVPIEGGTGREWFQSILSRFGPIREKASNTTVLDFEKPLVELDKPYQGGSHCR